MVGMKPDIPIIRLLQTPVNSPESAVQIKKFSREGAEERLLWLCFSSRLCVFARIIFIIPDQENGQQQTSSLTGHTGLVYSVLFNNIEQRRYRTYRNKTQAIRHKKDLDQVFTTFYV